jgi:hypothetical protein
MGFTSDEIVQIEEMAKVSPIVNKLWSEIQLMDQDPASRFYRSLVDCTNAISTELDAMHTGKYSQFKVLKGDPKTFKRVFQLLTKSKSIVDGLNKAKKLVGNKKEIKIKNSEKSVHEKKDESVDVDESNRMSFT